MSACLRLCCVAVLLMALATSAAAQFTPPPPPVGSPEVQEDRTVTFRLRAAKAEQVRLLSSDLPGLMVGADLAKEGDVWSFTTEAVPAGAYRYHFLVDGIRVVDPENKATSESNNELSSVVLVRGSPHFDAADTPQGTLAEVRYHSETLGKARRMHVYTPPGYEDGQADYPVFYLLHGASDSDDSWTSVGRAHVIFDNLIAAGDAPPMVVVMPDGHTAPFNFAQPGDFEQQMADFVQDFMHEVRPLVESRYRIKDGRANRAIAGLSMGGAHTLDIMAEQLGDFAYFGVFSSGVFSLNPMTPPPSPTWAEQHAATLNDASLKDGLELLWMRIGTQDFLLQISRLTVEMLQEHGFEVTYDETDGAHTWLEWRDYLVTFASALFDE
ncbi:MAG: alpha/beta hydrolase-fold protein [Bacteroidota bacterium]